MCLTVLLFLACFSLLECHCHVVHDRSTDEDGSVGTDDDTEYEGNCQTAYNLSAEDCDCKHGHQGGEGGVHGTGERAVESDVDVVLELCLRVVGPVFTDTVEDNHVIVA